MGYCIFRCYGFDLVQKKTSYITNEKGEKMSKDEKIDVCLEVKKETAKAFLVTDTNGELQSWIPKSQIIPNKGIRIGDTIIFTMPTWLATDKGFL